MKIIYYILKLKHDNTVMAMTVLNVVQDISYMLT